MKAIVISIAVAVIVAVAFFMPLGAAVLRGLAHLRAVLGG